MADENIKAKVEAALFLTEKPIRAQAIAHIVDADVDLVRRTVLELISDYEERNGGLEVADDNGYIIQVKDEYTTLVDEFVPMDMPTALVRTLSAIALKQPVMQSEIIKIRGGGAYEHIKELMERELINKKEDGGRSPMLSTTKKFQEYFRLSKDGNSLRQTLSKEAAKARAEAEAEEDAANQAELGDSAASIETTAAALTTESNSTTEETTIFDASPDPSTPAIGSPAEESATVPDTAIASKKESEAESEKEESRATVLSSIDSSESKDESEGLPVAESSDTTNLTEK